MNHQMRFKMVHSNNNNNTNKEHNLVIEWSIRSYFTESQLNMLYLYENALRTGAQFL